MGDEVYPLDHLQSFRFVVAPKDPLQAAATLEVIFTSHVVSEKWTDGIDEARRWIEHGEQRAFCPTRHSCSLRLPGLLRYHAMGKAFVSRDGNGAKNHLFHADKDGVPYPIFFRLTRARNIPGVHGILRVISAYPHPGFPPRHRLQSINFARLVHQTCPPRSPPRGG